MNLGFNTDIFKSLNMGTLKRLTDSQSTEDLNKFLEDLPKNTGQTILIVAGVIWSVAGALGLFSTVQIQNLTELRAEYEQAQAVLPPVPAMREVVNNPAQVSSFVERMKDIYSSLEITANGSNITIKARSTRVFGQFREAIGHVQNGGRGWRVNIQRLCVGRECGREPLVAELKINKVSVDKVS